MVYVKPKKTIELISCVIQWLILYIYGKRLRNFLVSFQWCLFLLVSTFGGRFKLNNCSTCVCWILDAIYQTLETVLSEYPNAERRVENTMRSGVFLTKFEMFG